MVEIIKYKRETIFFDVRLGIGARLFSAFIISCIYKFEKHARGFFYIY